MPESKIFSHFKAWWGKGLYIVENNETDENGEQVIQPDKIANVSVFYRVGDVWENQYGLFRKAYPYYPNQTRQEREQLPLTGRWGDPLVIKFSQYDVKITCEYNNDGYLYACEFYKDNWQGGNVNELFENFRSHAAMTPPSSTAINLDDNNGIILLKESDSYGNASDQTITITTANTGIVLAGEYDVNSGNKVYVNGVELQGTNNSFTQVYNFSRVDITLSTFDSSETMADDFNSEFNFHISSSAQGAQSELRISQIHNEIINLDSFKGFSSIRLYDSGGQIDNYASNESFSAIFTSSRPFDITGTYSTEATYDWVRLDSRDSGGTFTQGDQLSGIDKVYPDPKADPVQPTLFNYGVKVTFNSDGSVVNSGFDFAFAFKIADFRVDLSKSSYDSATGLVTFVVKNVGSSHASGFSGNDFRPILEVSEQKPPTLVTVNNLTSDMPINVLGEGGSIQPYYLNAVLSDLSITDLQGSYITTTTNSQTYSVGVSSNPKWYVFNSPALKSGDEFTYTFKGNFAEGKTYLVSADDVTFAPQGDSLEVIEDTVSLGNNHFVFTVPDTTAPVITSGTTGIDLVENSGAGQTVYTITATDAVGATSYAIGGADASLLTLTNNVVTLNANPDFETKSSYSFTVTASDAANNTSDATTVTFSITDVDDTAPVITSGTTGIDLVENSGAGQTVYTITATDAVGATSYAIGGADASLLTLTNNVVTLNANPDFETKSSYSFTVTASDAANNTSDATTVTFSITDVDDTAPVITSGTTGIDLVENSGAGQTVYTITATDAVGATSYAIGGADASLLTLTNNVVTLNANPDFETKSSYSFTVTASDAANNTSDATTVTFSITDVDDTAPVITSGTTGIDLVENSGAGQTVYTITATDAVGATSYAIGGADASLLTLTNNVVTLNANPDFETKSSYSFTVTASDAANNTSDATTVTFSITDVDDTAPVITSGTTGIDLVENSGAGQTVYTITATDAVGATSYAIGGADASLLTLTNNVVTLNANPDFETKSSYSFTVTASDAANNTSDATTVTFSITDVDDTAPVITSGTTGIDLVENSGAGQTVYTITATDAVGATSYAIGGADASLLTLTNNVVTLNANPDFETKSSYSFTVTASDAANNTSDATTVTFSITDVDEIAPTIAITSDKPSLAKGDTTTITFTLSEPSTDFAENDVTVTGGVLSGFSGSGTSYTATFTPADNSTVDGVISVASNKFSDAAGNQNQDGGDANNTLTVTIDTTRPSMAITSDKPSLVKGETTTVTFTLSEPSTDFAENDVAVTGGVLSGFSGSGTSYTATFTPADNSTVDGVISVASNKFSDAAGNQNQDGGDANNTLTVTIDTTRPAPLVGSGGGDPYIYPMLSEIPVKLPDKEACYRLYQDESTFINAEVIKATPEHQKRMKQFAKEFFPNVIEFISDGFFFSKFCIITDGNIFMIDLKTRKGYFNWKDESNIFNIKTGRGVTGDEGMCGMADQYTISWTTEEKKAFNTTIKFYDNPHIENGISITVDRLSKKALGLCVRNYRPKLMVIPNISTEKYDKLSRRITKSENPFQQKAIKQKNERWIPLPTAQH